MIPAGRLAAFLQSPPPPPGPSTFDRGRPGYVLQTRTRTGSFG